MLRPEMEQGGAYEGPLRIVIRGERTTRGRVVQMVSFVAPPYSLPFQPPGAFVAEVSKVGFGGQAVTATCEAGRSTEVRVTLPP